MKAYNRIFVSVILILLVLWAAANIILSADSSHGGRPYRVEINRLARQIEAGGRADISDCKYVTNIEMYGEDFYSAESDYAVREINGILYRFDYKTEGASGRKRLAAVNAVIAGMAAVIISVMLYVRASVIAPFERLSEIPYELSKGNLTVPVKESKNRFFGRFIWGVDMLRENIEQRKIRELELQKEKKMLLLSLSHDIKTPLSSIKLYSQALSKGLYESSEKQLEIAESINAKADEIENYLSQIVTASREDFLNFDINMGEFYLSQLVKAIEGYYKEKLSIIGTEFTVSGFSECLLKGDLDRAVEVVQNIMENAVKYGDGKWITLSISEEDGCILVNVRNSGCTLADTDLPHVFESFWRGANAEKISGCGLGLYISRKLMRKMNGEVFAEIRSGCMRVAAVFTKA